MHFLKAFDYLFPNILFLIFINKIFWVEIFKRKWKFSVYLWKFRKKCTFFRGPNFDPPPTGGLVFKIHDLYVQIRCKNVKLNLTKYYLKLVLSPTCKVIIGTYTIHINYEKRYQNIYKSIYKYLGLAGNL